MSTVVLITLIALGSLVYGLGLFFGLLLLFTHISGWSRLALLFRAAAEPPGYACARQMLRAGSVRYRGAYLNFGREGLYLRCGLPLHPPLLIPWPAFTGIMRDTLRWQPAVTLTVGQPRRASITLLAGHWPLLQQYLPAQLRDSPPA